MKIILKPVFIIAIVVVTMIGLMTIPVNFVSAQMDNSFSPCGYPLASMDTKTANQLISCFNDNPNIVNDFEGFAFAVGTAYHELNNNEKAIFYYKLALEQDYTNGDALALLCYVYLDEKKYAVAYDYASRAVNLGHDGIGTTICLDSAEQGIKDQENKEAPKVVMEKLMVELGAYAAEEVIEEVTQLTINSLEIYEDADYTRYRVTGDAPASTEITFKTTKPDGSSGNYPGGVDTGKPSYIVDNKIDSSNNLVYGTWTLEVCAPEYGVCVQESFTINEPVTLPDDGATQTEKLLSNEKSTEEGGGCLIATATYGSELAPQVQQLRELRDNQLLQTESGTAFMGTFNNVYYSFSPVIADMERESPIFKEIVKFAITPMISSLSLMENANSESEILSIGLSVIMLNIGMYVAVPAVVIFGIRRII